MFTTLSMTTAEGLQEMQDIFVPLFRKAGIRHDQTVIVYEDCLNTRYGGSCRGYFQLCLFGHQDVGILDGGLSQWLKDDLPVTADIAIPTLSSFQPSIKKDFLATLKDMIIYCFKGARAANTYIALKLAGFKHVRNYYGSWNEWSRHHELPIDDEKLAG